MNNNFLKLQEKMEKEKMEKGVEQRYYEKMKKPLIHKLYTFYQIVCKNEEIKETYVGTTVNLKKAISNHKSMCKRSDIKLYTFIRNNGGWENWHIKVLEIRECYNQYELDNASAEHRKHIKSIK